jgi:hypothetical protein
MSALQLQLTKHNKTQNINIKKKPLNNCTALIRNHVPKSVACQNYKLGIAHIDSKYLKYTRKIGNGHRQDERDQRFPTSGVEMMARFGRSSVFNSKSPKAYAVSKQYKKKSTNKTVANNSPHTHTHTHLHESSRVHQTPNRQ